MEYVVRTIDKTGGEFELQRELNDGWEIMRCDASGEAIVYILERKKKS